jgi:hypothetical protein
MRPWHGPCQNPSMKRNRWAFRLRRAGRRSAGRPWKVRSDQAKGGCRGLALDSSKLLATEGPDRPGSWAVRIFPDRAGADYLGRVFPGHSRVSSRGGQPCPGNARATDRRRGPPRGAIGRADWGGLPGGAGPFDRPQHGWARRPRPAGQPGLVRADLEPDDDRHAPSRLGPSRHGVLEGGQGLPLPQGAPHRLSGFHRCDHRRRLGLPR